MADEQKPTVEVPEVTKDDVAPVAAPEAEAGTAAEAADEAKPAEAAAPAAESAATADETKTDDHKDEVKPVEEGHLSHKAQGASFPK